MRLPITARDGDAALGLARALHPEPDSAIVGEPTDRQTAEVLGACSGELPERIEVVRGRVRVAPGRVYLPPPCQRLCVEDGTLYAAPERANGEARGGDVHTDDNGGGERHERDAAGTGGSPPAGSEGALELQRVLDGVGTYVWVLSHEGEVVRANAAAREATGTEAAGQPLESLRWWSHDEAVRQALREAVAEASGGETSRRDLDALVDGDGPLTLDLRVAPVTDASGRVTHLVASAVDVTPRERARRRVDRLDAKLKAMLENAQVGLAFFDAEHRYVRVNDGMAQMNGLPPERHIGRRLEDVVPANAPTVGPALDRVLRDGEAMTDVEMRGETPLAPGIERHWVCSYFPVVDGDGRVELVGVVVLEVTRQKRIEGALRESERRFRAMADALPAVAWTADRHMRWSYANPRLREVTGLPEESAFGESWLALIDERDRDATRRAIRRAVDTAEPLNLEHRFRVRDGTSHWFLTRARPILDDRGECVRWFGTSTDIHELKSAQGLLRRRLAQLGAIYRLSDAVARSSSRKQLYESAINALVEALGVDRAAILIGDRRGHMRCRASRGLGERSREAVMTHPPALDGGPPAGTVLVEHAGKELEGELREALVGEGVASVAFIPLQFGRRRLGELALCYDRHHRFAEDELHVAQTIAGHISFATERRRADRVLRASEERFRAAFEQAAVGVAYSEPNGRFTRVNDRLCEITGYSREELLEMRFSDVTHPDDVAEDVQNAAALLEGRLHTYSREKRYVRKDGTTVWINLTASVVRSRNGEAKHFLAVIEDITDRRQAESELHLRDRAIGAASNGVVICEARDDLPIIFVNDGFERLTGYRREEVLGQNCRLLQGEETDEQTVEQIRAALREGANCHVTLLNYRKDGAPFWNELVISPIASAEGEATHFVGVQTDVTELKQAQEKAEFLMAELNHRVKNSLATALSIADQTARGSDDLESFKRSFEGRMQALSHAHSLLSRDQWSGTTLRTLVDAVAQPFIGRDRSRLEISGPTVRIPPKAALSLSLILHELCTNASKYGSLSVEGGIVRMSWEVAAADDESLMLRWEESGGPPAAPPRRRGFGTKLFERSVQYELGGRVSLEYLPEGLCCEVAFPLRGWGGAAGSRRSR